MSESLSGSADLMEAAQGVCRHGHALEVCCRLLLRLGPLVQLCILFHDFLPRFCDFYDLVNSLTKVREETNSTDITGRPCPLNKA